MYLCLLILFMYEYNCKYVRSAVSATTFCCANSYYGTALTLKIKQHRSTIFAEIRVSMFEQRAKMFFFLRRRSADSRRSAELCLRRTQSPKM